MKPPILKTVLLRPRQGYRNWPFLVFGTWTFSLLALGVWHIVRHEDPWPDVAACSLTWMAGILAVSAAWDAWRRQAAWFREQEGALRAQGQVVEDLAQRRAEELARINAELEREVRQRQLVESALAERQAYLETLFQNVHTGLVITDPSTGKVVDINLAGAELLGLPRAEVIGQLWQKFLCPAPEGERQQERAGDGSATPEPREASSPLAEAGGVGSAPGEAQLLSRIRGPVPVLHKVSAVSCSGRNCHLHTLVDIQDRKRAEIAAQREAAKLSSMIAGMQEGVVFADARNVIVEVNDYFCRFAGLRRSEIIGRRLEEFHTGAVLERLLGHVQTFRTHRDNGPVVVQRPWRNAEVILRLQPIYAAGRYDGVLLNVLDVTELVTARRQAECASKAKARFLANMSHEIRTPMTAILGYAELLESPNLTAEERHQYLEIIRRNGHHLLQLISDILDLSKIEAGKLQLRNEPTDVRALVEDVAQSLGPRAAEAKNHLAVRCAPDLPPRVVVDADRLRQVIMNLVGNALKFTSEGSVQITVLLVPRWHGQGRGLRIEVADTGIGIPGEALPRLFAAFTQADESTTRRYGGTGLGLAICRHIVELMGGEISVQSTPGKGSVFTVTLPCRSDGTDLEGPQHLPTTPAPKTDVPHSSSPLAGMRILVAEDSPDNQQLIRKLLAVAGAEVQVVPNGREAVAAASAQTFDLVLMDLNMPEMGGDDATRLLRSQGYAGPIVALSASVFEKTRQQCIEAGFDAHLPKPIDRAQLLACVASYRRQSGLERPPCGPQPGPAEAPGERSATSSVPEA